MGSISGSLGANLKGSPLKGPSIQGSSSRLGLYSLRLFSAIILGLTVALATDEILDFGTFSFVFVLIVTALLVMAISKKWRLGAILIFDLILVLIGLILRMYLVVAPNL